MRRKGFTLIELLIVIAIIAVLATVVILTLNPAELLRQSRDSNRLSDMSNLKSAISLYLADIAVPFLGSSTFCYVDVGSNQNALSGNWEINNAGAATSTHANDCSLWMFSTTASTSAIVATTTNGTQGINGWLPVNFSAISSGSPLGIEPGDPVDAVGNSSCGVSNLSSCGHFYSYAASSTFFKVAAKMESLKFAYTGTNTSSPENTDGGNNPYMFEAGTSLSL